MVFLSTYYFLLLAGLATMLTDGLGWVALLTYFIAMPAGALLLRRSHSPGLPGLIGRPDAATIKRTLAMTAVAGATPAGLFALMYLLSWVTIEHNRISVAGLLVGVVAQQFVVAALEELTFRGTIQPIVTSYVSPTTAVIITSVLFGAFHIPNILFHDVPLKLVPGTIASLTLMGYVFGRAYISAGSWLGLPVALHFGWNTACFGLEDLFSFRYTGPAWITGTPSWFPESGLLGAAGLALLLIALRLSVRRNNRTKGRI